MKRTLAALVLCFLSMHLAVLAGAEDSIRHWVDELEAAESAAVMNSENPVCDVSVTENVGTERMVLPVNIGESGEEALTLGEIPQPEPLTAFFSSELSIRNDSSANPDLEEIAAGFDELNLSAEGPHVLIIHTHSSEAYTPTAEDMYEESDPYRTEDRDKNVVHVGDVLAEKLQSKGLVVIHDREIYDYPSYTGSYSRSGAAVEEYLARYPGIGVVIDLHRDALGSGDVVYKTRAETESGECAQIMLLVGTGENGLSHPGWKSNLTMGLYLQQAVEDSYPTLARPLVLKNERYNQHISPGSLILEVGSTGNTLAEAVTAAELFGEAAGEALAKLIAED